MNFFCCHCRCFFFFFDVFLLGLFLTSSSSSSSLFFAVRQQRSLNLSWRKSSKSSLFFFLLSALFLALAAGRRASELARLANSWAEKQQLYFFAAVADLDHDSVSMLFRLWHWACSCNISFAANLNRNIFFITIIGGDVGGWLIFQLFYFHFSWTFSSCTAFLLPCHFIE